MEETLRVPLKLYVNDPAHFDYSLLDDEQREIIRQVGVRNLLMQKYLEDIVRAFDAKCIKCIVLKGSHLANSIYPFGVRPAEDIDILIHPEDFIKAEIILRNFGYQDCAFNLPKWIHYRIASKITYKNNQTPVIPIDLHFNLGPYPYLGRINHNMLWDNIELLNTGKFSFNVLQPEILLIHLCLHLFQHIHEDWQVSCYDLISVIRHNDRNIDWDKFCQMVKNYKVSLPVCFSLNKALLVLRIQIPEFVISELNTTHMSWYEKRLFIFAMGQLNDFERYLLQFVTTRGILLKLKCAAWIIMPRKNFLKTHNSGSYSRYIIQGFKAVGFFIKRIFSNRI